MRYEVVLPGRPPGGVEAAARNMAESFGISETKAAALLRRAPGPLTKGIDEREAVRVAYRLRKLGLAVEVRPVGAQPVATTVGRAEQHSGSGTTPSASSASAAGSTATAASTADPTATSSGQRSPFLSQVDEAPPPIPGLDAMPPSGPPDRRQRDRRGDSRNGRAAPVRRPAYPTDSQRSGAASSESLRTEAGGSEDVRPHDPLPEAARPDEPRAEPLPQPDVAPASRPESEPATAIEEVIATGGFGSGEATSPTASGSWRLSEPYRTGDRPAPAAAPVRSARSPLGWRLLVAAVLPGLLSLGAVATIVVLIPDPSFALALGVGVLVLALATGWIWATGRSLVREHDRVMAETLRISRGDLARPVQASDRYPEAVQALERIRVSLQEGLDRLRRRKR